MKGLNRNDLCWCGSGIKYKKCHLREDEKLFVYEQEGYELLPMTVRKSPEQIQGIRLASQLVKKTLDMVGEKIKEGVSTDDINTWVHEFTIENGGIPATLNYYGYPKSVCTSVNEVICHGIPDPKRILKSGDIINVDVTSILNGYYGDASRMYMIGEVSEEARKLVEVTKECMYLGIEAVKPYGDLNDVGRAIEAHAKKFGFSVVRDYGGHGVGLDIHEDPHVNHFAIEKKGFLLMPGMVITVEPMINQGTWMSEILDDEWTAVTADGKLSAQWEHTILITETGVEILT